MRKQPYCCTIKEVRMLKFRVGADCTIEIAENDRGKWFESVTVVGMSTGKEFWGFSGENSLVIIPMSMQSGIKDVVVVHSMVDGYSRVAHRSGTDLEAVINQCVKEVYGG